MTAALTPPFTEETAREKVQRAEDAWNSRDPDKVVLAYTEDSEWRNRDLFLKGREEIRAFLKDKWSKERDYKLRKELWAYCDNRIAVRFEYEWRNDRNEWFRSYGNEMWEFDAAGLMARRYASINDVPFKTAGPVSSQGALMTVKGVDKVQRFASFARGEAGGNPAGVVIAAEMPSADDMQKIAAAVGYSETAFAVREDDAWRVRYFAPAGEVAFCGHATIALGAALAEAHGDGVFSLRLNDGAITVEGAREGVSFGAALVSPPTKSREASPSLVVKALQLFGYTPQDLSSALRPAIINAGNDHLLIALRNREALAALKYDLSKGATFMAAHGLTTVSFIFAETPRKFHSRNAFAIGGVLEDPATGAAAAALGGLLRDIGWPHGGAIEIIQGEDMGAPSALRVGIGAEPGAGVSVSGKVRKIS